jgi:hypothetical protein
MAQTSNVTIGNRSASSIAAHQTIVRKLGPMPRRSLAALQDYGLDDADIARYLGLTCASVRRLCRTLGVDDPGGAT